MQQANQKTTRYLGTAPRPAFLLAAILFPGLTAAGVPETETTRFTEHLIKGGYAYSFGIAAADLNGDGHLDLTSADALPHNRLYWFENDGAGNFREHLIEKNYPDRLERHAIGDINGDGKPDVVIIENLRGDVLWYKNSGRATADDGWQRFTISKGTIPGAYDVALADLNGDGHLDVAVSTWRLGNKFVWFENPGGPEKSPPWKMRVIEENIAETRTVRIGDFNRDGKPDLLGTARGANQVAWYENPGKAGQFWKKHTIDAKSPQPTHGHPVDMDGDGDADVVMALGMTAPPGMPDTRQIVWYENVGRPGNGTEWKKRIIAEDFGSAFEAVAADLNGDGHVDVAATAWGPNGRVVWFENSGDPRGTWKMHKLKKNWPRANQIIVGDFNGDKRPDVAAGAERGANEVRWWRNEGRKSVRYPIPASRIQAEIGHCYVASMDFAEDGDKETGNKSGLLVCENGKPLGPARAAHQEIREKGRGRFSHWTRHGLYLSTSDNTDPRSNGRMYEIASANPESALAGGAEVRSTPKRHVEVIRGSHHEYSLRLRGNLDYENSHTRFNTGFTIAFQPNVALCIANTGPRPVFWPKLVANGTHDWSTCDALLADFTRGASDDQQRALLIWQTARENRYHCSPLFPDNEFHDPVKIFNSYGLNLCDDMGYCGCSMFKHAGLAKPKYAIDPKVRSLNGHVMCEAVVDGRHQFLDIDESAFYLDRENERPVSGDACARDHDLVRREVHFGPQFGGWADSEASAAIFGNDDRAGQLFLRGHEMSYSLRPGERAVFRWDNIGKYAAHSKKWDQEPPFYGNSKFIYAPRLAPAHYKEGIQAESDVVTAMAPGALLAGGSASGRLVYAVNTPWAICGGTMRAEFVGLAAQDKFALEVGTQFGGSAVQSFDLTVLRH